MVEKRVSSKQTDFFFFRIKGQVKKGKIGHEKTT